MYKTIIFYEKWWLIVVFYQYFCRDLGISPLIWQKYDKNVYILQNMMENNEKSWENHGKIPTFLWKITTSTDVRDSIHDVDDVQTPGNFSNGTANIQSTSLITPLLANWCFARCLLVNDVLTSNYVTIGKWRKSSRKRGKICKKMVYRGLGVVVDLELIYYH